MSADEVVVQKKDGKTFSCKFDEVKSFIDTDDAASQLEKNKKSATGRHVWKIGPEFSSIKYEEPGVMKEKGMMYGVGAAYSYHNGVMFGADIKYSYGQVDYESNGSGTINDIDDNMLEIRGVGGYDFKMSSSFVLTPFFGFGYRYLRDDTSGRTSTTGARGYLRESNYYYSPLGLTASKDFNNGWTIGLTLEYDIFWKGVQKSYLRDANPGFNNLENDQSSGHGMRGSLLISKKIAKISFALEPYIKYWDIGKSDNKLITFNGVPWGIGWEPENNSTEVGVKFRVIF
ncbi:MAG TPA: autotransporter outer membrane beta-barrel domain-containing protein [Smithella sp.]|nr:autotransporter outer membrane beta-barrel domain-containing protein [Smithella sp.]HPL49087.1 autotransporter outer membrane beta-barrel domain-containing protein [Smithella sp.]